MPSGSLLFSQPTRSPSAPSLRSSPPDLAALCTDSPPRARRLTEFPDQTPPDHPDLQRTHRTILIPAKAPKTGTLPPFAIAKHHRLFHFRLT